MTQDLFGDKRGKMIVLEGTDSSGKQTQASMLVERLIGNGISCFDKIVSFPQYNTPTGRIVGQCYLGKKSPGERYPPWRGDVAWFGEADSVDPKIASLYYAADRRAEREKLLRIMDMGENLVIDRYVESNMAHQGGKEIDQDKRERIINFIEKLEYGLLELPKPDEIIFLYMPWEDGMKLKKREGTAKDGHESNPDHLKNAEETYLYLARKYNWTRINCVSDGQIRTIEDIHEKVFEHALRIL